MTSPTGLSQAEEIALGVLRWLVSSQGAAEVSAVLGLIVGGGPGMLISEASNLIADILRALIPTLGGDRVEAEVSAMFDASDVAADAAEDAKFGVPK